MRARRSFKRFARDLATASSDLAGAELIFGELAANGVEHSRGEMTLVLAQDDAELVLLGYHGDDWGPPAVASTRPPPRRSTPGEGAFSSSPRPPAASTTRKARRVASFCR